MPTYGIRISDTSGNTLLLTPELQSIVSSGRTAMPNSLNPDNTYGIDIDLPGTDSIAQDSLGVLASSFIMNINLTFDTYTVLETYAYNWIMANAYTFYTRNDTTGVMTVWTPGTVEPAFDSCLSVYPVAFWDKLGQTSFTAIRIFAATRYVVYDWSTVSYKYVYSIGNQGVENVDYAIYMKKYPVV